MIPIRLIEGCSDRQFAMGGAFGYIYIRGEYIREIGKPCRPPSTRPMTRGLLGDKRGGLGLGFRPLPAPRRGGLICGEETALIESLEGKKGDAADEAAVPGGRGALWLPDPR